jgi:hypothetical protein
MSCRLAALAALIVTSAPATARQNWEAIGLRSIAEFPSEDVIAVAGNESHREIRLCAMGGTVRIIDVDLRYVSGDHMLVPARARLARGTCTDPIELDSGERLAQVRLNYERFRRRGPAMVRIDAR